MAANLFLSRTLLLLKPKSTTSKTLIGSLVSRCFCSLPVQSPSRSSSLLRLLRPVTAVSLIENRAPVVSLSRSFSTRATTSSLNDPNPNWSNRPPKETILLDGCDFEHWLVVMEPPEGDPTRDEIIESYIKTLAQVVGSEEEARMKIYSVSTRCYYAFGALVSEELSYKIKELPRVRWVLPDSYLDVKNKDYGGEPFIDGKAVPYDPKYHEEWIRNNARAQERNRRNDRPRNYDRSRSFDRRRENMASREFQNRAPSNQGTQYSSPNQGGPPPPANYGGGPRGPLPPPPNFGGEPGGPPPPPPNFGGGPGGPPPPPPNFGGGPGGPPPPPPNFGGGPGGPPPPPPNYGGGPRGPPPPPPNYGAGPGGPPPPSPNYGTGPGGPPSPPQNYGSGPVGPPPNYMGGQHNTGGMPPNAGWSNTGGNMQQNYPNGPSGGMPYQGGQANYQNNYPPSGDSGNFTGGRY